VNGPTEKVSDAALYHLDQFVMKGKPVLFFVSGMKWQGAGQQQMQMVEGPQPYVGMPSEGGVAPLLRTYGFEVGQNVILDNRNFDFFAPPGSPRGMMYKFLAPVARSEQTGTAQILQGIEGVLVPLASTLKLVGPLEKPGEETTVIQLLRTQDTSWARKDVIAISPQLQLDAPVGGERGPYLVAVAVKGRFKSFFEGKPVPAGADQPAAPSPTPGLDQGEADEPAKPVAPAAPAPTGAVSPSNTRIVVVTAPAMVADTSLLTRNYMNGFKAAHAMVDWLAEDQDLSAARAKTIARPINRLDPATRTIVKAANIVSGPLILIVFGLVYWRVRESRRRDIKL
jgi:ABC-2 type transport system permease protein